ncbi:MAG: phenylalanine--tRNA ligase subunit alpha [bacterium]
MLDKLKQKALQEIQKEKSLDGLEEIYRKYLGRKGELTNILRSLKDLSEAERKKTGRLANQVKQEIEKALYEKKNKETVAHKQPKEWIDVSAPGHLHPHGHIHPITLVERRIEDIFQSMGFSILDGPEVENEYYNFDSLNIPKNHPARDAWDTFLLKESDLLLRTHTSPMQARYMEKNNPPLRILAPGRCFRHEATDASHDVQFYQVEGLMIGKDISVANFKGVIETFLKQFFGPELKMRLRPGYFPFVEPGFEIDIKRKDPAAAKALAGKNDWLEVMGAGMVHPNVLKAVGYLPNKWQGFAFGIGSSRLALLKYDINDIRLLSNGDLRFLKQF